MQHAVGGGDHGARNLGPVAQHGRLRMAGRAAGEHDEQAVLGIHATGHRLHIGALEPALVVGAERDDRDVARVGGGEDGRMAIGDECERRLGEAQRVLQLRGGLPRVVAGSDGAEHPGGQHDLEVFAPVLRQHGDAVAAGHAKLAQRPCQPVDALHQRAVGRGDAVLDHGRVRRARDRALPHQRVHCDLRGQSRWRGRREGQRHGQASRCGGMPSGKLLPHICMPPST